MRLTEFTDTHAEKQLNEAGPAVVALPVGAAAMEALALALGFAGAAALTVDIQRNPDKYNRAMRGMASAYAAVQDMLRGDSKEVSSDAASELEQATTSAIASQPEEVQQSVTAQTQEIISQVDQDADEMQSRMAAGEDPSAVASDFVASLAQDIRGDAAASRAAGTATSQVDTTDDARAAATRAALGDLATPEPAPQPAADVTTSPSMAAPAVSGTAGNIPSRADDRPVSTTVPPALTRTGQADVAPRVDTTPPERIGDNDVDLGVDATGPRVGDADAPADAGAAGGAAAGGAARPDTGAGAAAGGIAVPGSTDVPDATDSTGSTDIPDVGDVTGSGVDAATSAAAGAAARSAAQSRAVSQARTQARTRTTPKPRRGFVPPNLGLDDAEPASFRAIQVADPLRTQRFRTSFDPTRQ